MKSKMKKVGKKKKEMVIVHERTIEQAIQTI